MAQVNDGFAAALARLPGFLARLVLTNVVGLAALTGAAAVSAYAIAADGSVLRGLLGAGLAALACAAFGGALAFQRTVAGGLLAAVERLALGRRLSGALFDRMLGLAGAGERRAEGAAGDRGRAVAAVLDAVPLAQAEAWLRQAIQERLRADAGGATGFLRRRLERGLIERVETLTLARFREAGRGAGSVDLVRLKDELGEGIDGRIAAMAGGAVTRITILMIVGGSALAVLLALGVRRLPL